MSLLTVSSHFAQSQFAQWVRVRGLGLWDWAKWGRTLLTILQSFHIILICAALLWGNEEWFMNSDKSISMFFKILINSWLRVDLHERIQCMLQSVTSVGNDAKPTWYFCHAEYKCRNCSSSRNSCRQGGGSVRAPEARSIGALLMTDGGCPVVSGRPGKIDRSPRQRHACAASEKKHAIVYAYMNVVCPAWGMIERVPALKAEDRDMNLSPNLYTIFVTPCSTVFWLWQD